MNLNEHALKIEQATLSVSILPSLPSAHSPVSCRQTIAEGKTITGDLGGKASTKQFTDAIVAKLT